LALLMFLGPLVAGGDELQESVEHARALSRAFRQASAAASPAVVTVVSKVRIPAGQAAQLREMLRDPRFRQMFPDGELPFELPQSGESSDGVPKVDSHVGSGVIIDRGGIVLTNSHVVEDADEVVVRFADGRELVASDIKRDPMSDLAIMRIKASQPLPAARLGNSSALEIGDWVIAIGSPFELEATVSAGIISGKGRTLEQIRRGKLLQTDAAINPGNSGGPLVNLSGEVVGINTAIATNNGGYQGIGFAIPIDHAQWIVRELLTHGAVRRAYLGIRLGDVTPQVARRLGVPVRAGVAVVGVLPDSPAAAGGLQADDVIVTFGGEEVRDARDLQQAVEQKPIGSRQEVQLLRGGQSTHAAVVVQALPPEAFAPAPQGPPAN